jgi:hypothetical protein
MYFFVNHTPKGRFSFCEKNLHAPARLAVQIKANFMACQSFYPPLFAFLSRAKLGRTACKCG